MPDPGAKNSLHLHLHLCSFLVSFTLCTCRYPDFERSDSGLQYKDYKQGTGPLPENGDTVVLDWAGYTIGYYGRPFEARNKVGFLVAAASGGVECCCAG